MDVSKFWKLLKKKMKLDIVLDIEIGTDVIS